MLKRASRTRLELVERLVRAGHDRGSAARVAQELKDTGVIDEGAVAASLVRAAKKAGKSRGETERLLRERGVEDSQIRAAVESEELADDYSLALGAAREMARRGRGARPGALARRVLEGLARRGFDEELALRAAREVLGGLPSDDEGG